MFSFFIYRSISSCPFLSFFEQAAIARFFTTKRKAQFFILNNPPPPPPVSNMLFRCFMTSHPPISLPPPFSRTALLTPFSLTHSHNWQTSLCVYTKKKKREQKTVCSDVHIFRHHGSFFYVINGFFVFFDKVWNLKKNKKQRKNPTQPPTPPPHLITNCNCRQLQLHQSALIFGCAKHTSSRLCTYTTNTNIFKICI